MSSEYETLLKQVEKKSKEISDLTKQTQIQKDQLEILQQEKHDLSLQAKFSNELKETICKYEIQLNQTKRQLNEILSERNCLQKTNSNNLMVISGLQARIDDLKRSDSTIESALKSTINSLREDNMNKENELSAKFKQV